jgi:hypothetical protein
VIESVVP